MTFQYTFTRSSDQRTGQTRGPAVLPAVCRHLQGGQSCGSRQESVSSAMLKSSRSVTNSPFPTVGTCALHAPPRSTLHAPPRPDPDTPPFSSPSFASARRRLHHVNLPVNPTTPSLMSKKSPSQLSSRRCKASFEDVWFHTRCRESHRPLRMLCALTGSAAPVGASRAESRQ